MGNVIPAVAYADDLTLIAESKYDMMNLLEIVNKFCKKTNTQKSVYTNNLKEVDDLEWNINGETKIINKCLGSKANKYLGIWITIDYNWNTQLENMQKNLNMNLAKFNDHNFTIPQIITILNSIIIPKIRYIQYVIYQVLTNSNQSIR